MGLLDHLWDDTVAGPRPDPTAALSSSAPSPVSGGLTVTRSITILRSNSSGSEPDSPLTPTTPTPRTPRGEWRRPRPRPEPAAEPRNPTVYDWVVISALDR